MVKIKYILILVLVNWISIAYNQQVEIVTKTIEPLIWTNVPVVLSKHIKGGIHSLATISDTSSIPSERRENGMFCFITNSNSFFQLLNNKWVKVLVNYNYKTKLLVADTGSFFYNKSINGYEYFDGGQWISVATGPQIADKNLNIFPNTETYMGVITKFTNAFPLYKPISLSSVGYGLANNTILNNSQCVGLVLSDTTILNLGYVKNSLWNFIIGDKIYLGIGDITPTIPTILNSYVQILGYAVSTNTIFFNPNSIVQQNIASSVVKPSVMQNNVGELGLPLEVTENPQATSRAWFYSLISTGPFDNAINNTTLYYTPSYPDFGSKGVKFIVCKSTFNGGVVTSAPVKVFFGKDSIIPYANQVLSVATNGIVLTVETDPVAISNVWEASQIRGGPYTIPLGTATTYTPNFPTLGTYYIRCKSIIGGNTLFSNEVFINVQ